jgi:glycosyltransferase involved in cell wall biosynthesis
MPPSIGVVIPMHNASATIDRTLDSVTAQRRPADAVVVVDDHSEDRSAAIVVARGYRVVPSSYRGAAAARNHGVEVVGTDFVAFLDADDCWPADYLTDIERSIVATDADIHFAPRLDLDEQGRVFGYRAPPRAVMNPRDLLLRGNPITTSGTVVRTALVASVGGFDETIRHCEDLDLWIRLLDQGARITTTVRPTLYTVRDSREPLAKVRDVEHNRRGVLASASKRLGLTSAERRRARAIHSMELGCRYVKSGHRLDAARCFLSGAALPQAWPLLALVPLPMRLQHQARQVIRARRRR